jgi:hypothetical protein
MNPYFLLLGSLAAWYIPTGYALYKMKLSLQNFSIVQIDKDFIDISIDLLAKNNTIVPFTISEIDTNVLINNKFVSQILAKNIQVPSNGSNVAKALLRLKKEELGASLWNIIIANDLNNTSFTFKGIAKSYGRTYPFEATYTFNELLSNAN